MNDIFQQPVPPAFASQPGPLLPHQAQPVAEVVVPATGKKGRRGPRKPKEAVAAAPAAPKKGRPRKPAAAAAAPARTASTVRLDLAVAIDALIGLTADEAKLVSGIVTAMQPFKGAERIRILGAVNKVLA